MAGRHGSVRGEEGWGPYHLFSLGIVELLLADKVPDALEADKTFDMLMGTDVSLRKSFIQNNAKMVELDI